MAAGRFHTPGTVERIRSDAEADASGRIDLTDDSNWLEYWRGRMEVIAVTARERIYAQQPVHDCTHRVTVRRSTTTAGIRARDRIRIGGRTLNITGVVDVGDQRRFVELTCVEERP